MATIPGTFLFLTVYCSSTPLRVGYYDTNGYFSLLPCMRRAVKETRSALQAAGHQLVPFSPPRIPYVLTELFMKMFYADGGRAWLDVFTGNIVDPSLKAQVNTCKIPRVVKKLLALLLKPLAVSGTVGMLVAVQCVALPWQEELCLRFMKEVETLSGEKRVA